MEKYPYFWLGLFGAARQMQSALRPAKHQAKRGGSFALKPRRAHDLRRYAFSGLKEVPSLAFDSAKGGVGTKGINFIHL